MDLTHNRRKTHHRLLSGSLRAGCGAADRRRKAVCLNLALVILGDYSSLANCLNWQQFRLGGEGAGRRGGVAIRRGLEPA